MSISVLILALDEELTLPRCLESVSWSDDIIVLDSGSTDRTVEIAKTFGARVVTRPFDDERTHRTYSLREIEFRHPWVYNPDADEVTPAELRDEMHATVDSTELIALIQESEQILADNAILHPLYARLVTAAVWADEIGGFKHNPTRAGYTWNIEDWYRADG